jgi:hypothetical protein
MYSFPLFLETLEILGFYGYHHLKEYLNPDILVGLAIYSMVEN